MGSRISLTVPFPRFRAKGQTLGRFCSLRWHSGQVAEVFSRCFVGLGLSLAGAGALD